MADMSPDDIDGGDESGTPRWVVVFGIVAVVLIAVFVIAHLMGGGLRGHLHR